MVLVIQADCCALYSPDKGQLLMRITICLVKK